MKKILFALLLSIGLNIYAQNDKYGPGAVPIKNGVVTFTQITDVPNTPKDKLYSSAKMAIADIFKSANDVIQSDDKESGVIICKGNAKTADLFLAYLMEFTLKISCKDNKYKVDIYDIDLTIGYGEPTAMKQNCNETITDQAALKEDGKLKKMGGGKQRKIVIDKKDEILATITSKISQSSTEEDW